MRTLSMSGGGGAAPPVGGLGAAAGLLARLGVPYADVVYVGAVQVVRDGVEGQFSKLLDAADDDGVAGLCAPDRQRCPPIALAAEGPVEVVPEPGPGGGPPRRPGGRGRGLG